MDTNACKLQDGKGFQQDGKADTGTEGVPSYSAQELCDSSTEHHLKLQGIVTTEAEANR